MSWEPNYVGKVVESQRIKWYAKRMHFFRPKRTSVITQEGQLLHLATPVAHGATLPLCALSELERTTISLLDDWPDTIRNGVNLDKRPK